MNITRAKLKETLRTIVNEESEYQSFFKAALEKAGKSIPSMSDEEKKAFFDKIDATWDGRGEKNEELVGGQKKLDVDKDGDIGSDDLADLRAGKKVDEASYPTDLKIGSVILGQGFTRLKGIDGGKYYKVVDMDSISATFVPSDKNGNTKGSKKVRHRLGDIDGGIKTAKRGDENGIVVIKESVNEAIGNDKSMLALVDILSNSMEYYEDDSDFLQAVRGGQGWSGIAGFKNSSLIPVFKSIYKKYWTVSPQNRTNWITKNWINWLKPFGLEENVNSETDTFNEAADVKKRFMFDFYTDSNQRNTERETNFLATTLESAIKAAEHICKVTGYAYVEIYYKDLFLGSMKKQNGFKFVEGRGYPKFKSIN
jgi:hypothetical protein